MLGLLGLRVGDTVRIIPSASTHHVRNGFSGDAIFRGLSTEDRLCVALELLNGGRGCAQNGWWNFRIEDLPLLMKVNSSKTQNIMSQVSKMMKKLLDADTQILIKAGFLDSNLELTSEGKTAIWGVLFDTHKAQLVEAAKEVIAEAEKKD